MWVYWMMLVHRLLWRLLLAPLYAVAEERVLEKRGVLAGAGIVLLGLGSTGVLGTIISVLAKLVKCF